jgi:hypothetical protein
MPVSVDAWRNHQQLVEAYQAAAHEAFRVGSATPLQRPPAGARDAQIFDITKKNSLNVQAGAVVIKGHLFVFSTVIASDAKPTWYACGPAPVPPGDAWPQGRVFKARQET